MSVAACGGDPFILTWGEQVFTEARIPDAAALSLVPRDATVP